MEALLIALLAFGFGLVVGLLLRKKPAEGGLGPEQVQKQIELERDGAGLRERCELFAQANTKLESENRSLQQREIERSVRISQVESELAGAATLQQQAEARFKAIATEILDSNSTKVRAAGVQSFTEIVVPLTGS